MRLNNVEILYTIFTERLCFHSDLQMRVTSYSVKQVELTCNTSCSLTTKPLYYRWFKNGQQTSWSYEHQKVLSAGPGSYSCSVNIHDQIYSNTVCEYERWSYLTVYEPVRSEGDDLLLLQVF